jgi:hypothetical protein
MTSRWIRKETREKLIGLGLEGLGWETRQMFSSLLKKEWKVLFGIISSAMRYVMDFAVASS